MCFESFSCNFSRNYALIASTDHTELYIMRCSYETIPADCSMRLSTTNDTNFFFTIIIIGI